MVDTNSPEWEIHYSNVMRRSRRRLEQMLDRFGESLQGWLSAALNWPREDWEADLADFIAHSRMTGIELSDESLGQIRGLIEARVNGTGVFAEQAPDIADPEKPAIPLASITLSLGSGTDATVDVSEGPKEEVAGPGPETSLAFNQKVQALLNLLDPDVAGIWRKFQGVVRVRDPNWVQFSYYSERNKKQLVIVVSPHFTVEDTAVAIIEEAYTSFKYWFSSSTNAIHSEVSKLDKLTAEDIAQRFVEVKTEAFKEAAATAAFFAESYYGAIASLTPGADVIVTIDDIDRNGFNFTHLLFALPALAYLRKSFKRLILKLPGGKTLELPGELLEKLGSLSARRQKKLIARAKQAKSEKEAIDKLTREVAASLDRGQIHHPISDEVYKALQTHSILKDKYQYRDRRFELIAVREDAHLGFEEWHRKLDEEVAEWVRRNKSADEAQFEAFLRKRYSAPDVQWRFVPDSE